VTHLCCNNGVELLSVKNLGAACVSGSIYRTLPSRRPGNGRSTAGSIASSFGGRIRYCAEYEDRFDVVYISAAGWLDTGPGIVLCEGGGIAP